MRGQAYGEDEALPEVPGVEQNTNEAAQGEAEGGESGGQEGFGQDGEGVAAEGVAES